MDIADRSVREGQDAVGFNNLDQIAVFVFCADAARYMTVLGDRVFQVISDMTAKGS